MNQGSSLAKAQTLLQLLNGVQAVNGKKSQALAHLGDGLGEAADDMTPGSAFLKELNARPRCPTVPYHILAGDAGVLPPDARREIEDRVRALNGQRGMLGSLSRLATSDLSTRLDELCEGTGDGCVSIARTKLDGVTDHVTIHANHAELIRAPLLFADPGPVACMRLRSSEVVGQGDARVSKQPTPPRHVEATKTETNSAPLGIVRASGSLWPRIGAWSRSPRRESGMSQTAELKGTEGQAGGGHPRGLYILFATEMWERFGFYTAASIMTLYLQRGGFGWTKTQATTLWSNYLMFVYITPLIGGWLADKFLGYRRSILIGGIIFVWPGLPAACRVGLRTTSFYMSPLA